MKNRFASEKTLIASLLLLALPCLAAARTDKTDLPFIDDPGVVGRWQSIAYEDSIEQFSPGDLSGDDGLFFKGLEFLPGGRTDDGAMSSWTEGVVLSTAMKTASRYVIKRIGGFDYMFLEWKRGDYILRDMDPGYYVLMRVRDRARMEEALRAARKTAVGEAGDCLGALTRPGVCRRPAAAVFERLPPASLPGYDRDSGKMWQLDLRSMDLSALDLSARTTDLLYADFDSRTRFPRTLPDAFSPARIMESGKDPGLGLRALHREGLTGKGVAIAIIDQPLLVGHREYAAVLKSYEEMHVYGKTREAAMHGGAVASIAVGRTCGVAPDAELYYIATDFADAAGALDFAYLAAAIDRLLAMRAASPDGKRIRAISISRGFKVGDRGAEALLASIEKAKRQGVLVMTTSPELYYDFDFMGLGREPTGDPDLPGSYEPGLFWAKRFFTGARAASGERRLLVPMDSRTTASPTGDEDYVFYRSGGLSWSVPYIVGLYALAVQGDPAMTPEAFLRKALAVSGSATVAKDGKEFALEGLVRPARLLGRE